MRVEITVPYDDALHWDHTAERDLMTVKVCEKDIYELHNAWETFDVTFAVRQWLGNPSRPQFLKVATVRFDFVNFFTLDMFCEMSVISKNCELWYNIHNSYFSCHTYTYHTLNVISIHQRTLHQINNIT